MPPNDVGEGGANTTGEQLQGYSFNSPTHHGDGRMLQCLYSGVTHKEETRKELCLTIPQIPSTIFCAIFIPFTILFLVSCTRHHQCKGRSSRGSRSSQNLMSACRDWCTITIIICLSLLVLVCSVICISGSTRIIIFLLRAGQRFSRSPTAYLYSSIRNQKPYAKRPRSTINSMWMFMAAFSECLYNYHNNTDIKDFYAHVKL